MEIVVQQLDLSSHVNFTEKLKFMPKKGFYCAIQENGKTKCLGHGKGRSYSPISSTLREYLDAQFAIANLALVKLLKRYKFPVPSWLVHLA